MYPLSLHCEHSWVYHLHLLTFQFYTWLIYLFNCIFAFTDGIFPFMFLVVTFSFSPGEIENISFKAGCWCWAFQLFFLCTAVASPSGLYESFAEQRVRGCRAPFHHFNVLCHCLLASSFYWKARWRLYGNFLPCGFFPAPLFLKFPIFITVCLGVELFELIVFGTFWISCLFPLSGERSFWLLGLQICSLSLSLFLFHLRHL